MINSNYILILSFFVLSIPYIEYGYVISFPQELFGNLLLLYCSHGLHDRAADILAENSHLTYDLLSQEMYDYLDASLMVTANPIEAVKKFETISNGHLKNLRRLIKAVAEANIVKRLYST